MLNLRNKTNNNKPNGNIVKVRDLPNAPPMKIVREKDNVITCIWFSKNEGLHKAQFKIDDVEYVQLENVEPKKIYKIDPELEDYLKINGTWIEFVNAVKYDKRIPPIKMVRLCFLNSLKEAKDYVDDNWTTWKITLKDEL